VRFLWLRASVISVRSKNKEKNALKAKEWRIVLKDSLEAKRTTKGRTRKEVKFSYKRVPRFQAKEAFPRPRERTKANASWKTKASQ